MRSTDEVQALVRSGAKKQLQNTPLPPKYKQVVQISCGLFHAAAVTVDGWLFTWGRGEGGRLGNQIGVRGGSGGGDGGGKEEKVR